MNRISMKRTSMKRTSFPRTALLMLLGGLVGCATVQVAPAPEPETPAETDQRATHWQFDAGTRPPADRDGYRPPVKLAVLLPLTGTLATAAQPVRDGLLAGYYGEQRRRPELAFYDTGGTAGGAGAAYSRAVDEGADQVLGPLGREEIDAVYRGVQASAPVIALNRSDTVPPPNSASFALAPEDDGIAAADFLLARGAKRVLVLAGDGDSARRSVAAFRERLQAQDGSVVQALPVHDDTGIDLTPQLRAAAQAEGGVDAVFLALRGPEARAMAPQLSAAGLSLKPRVATAQLTSGTGKPEEDRALDGIAYPTEVWGVSGARGLPPAASAGATLPTARGAAARLFAFGYDAWQLTAYLERLALDADARIDGATGALRIDSSGNVVRTPAWSTFNGGIAVPLAGTGG